MLGTKRGDVEMLALNAAQARKKAHHARAKRYAVSTDARLSAIGRAMLDTEYAEYAAIDAHWMYLVHRDTQPCRVLEAEEAAK